MYTMKHLTRRLALLGLCSVCTLAGALGLQPLGDEALAEVGGRDGVSFAVAVNQHLGSFVWGSYDTLGAPATLVRHDFSLSGTFLSTLDIRRGAPGQPDFIDWSYPLIATTKPLQMAYDLAITANGSTLGTGVTFQNIVLAGGSMQWTTSPGGGITFGLAVNTSVDQVLLQPTRGNTAGQMAVSGVKLSGASAGSPWVLADVAAQPGEFHVLNDAGGDQLQWTLNWPSLSTEAGIGRLQINNMTFTTPTGSVDLGSSSIGSMQIQYLNVKFKS